MSLSFPFGRAVLDRLLPRQNQPNVFDPVVQSLNRISDKAPQPYTFIQSNLNALSSNAADGVVIIQSDVMRNGERGVVEDFNVNYTTVAGTVRIVKISGYGGNILVDVVRGIAASQSGVGSTVLEEGEAIAVAGQAAGAGTFSVFFSGKKYNLGGV